MKKIWKWILGIVIALVVIAVVTGVFFLARNHRMMTFVPRNSQFNQTPNGSTVPNGPNGQSNPNGPYRPMMPRSFGDQRAFDDGQGGFGSGPMMMHHGYPPFFLGLMFFFGLAKLLVLGLLLYGAYGLGRKSAIPTVTSGAAAPTASASPQPSPKRGRKVAKG
jgi:hypothetical protein